MGQTLAAITFTLMALAGCTPQQVQPDSFCSWAKPITVSKSQDKLSAETAREILAFNEKGAKLCGWK